jgi:hypothetical protein
MKKVTIDGGDFLAEQHTALPETTKARGKRDPGWTCSAAGEKRDDDHIVGEAIANVFRDHQSRSWLMQIIGLAGSENHPQLPSSRLTA